MNQYQQPQPRQMVQGNQQNFTNQQFGYPAQNMPPMGGLLFPQIQPQQKSSNTIFIGDIDTYITEEMIWNKLKDAGNIYNVKLFANKTTGESKGCAMVDFEKENDMTYAINKYSYTRLFGDQSKRVIICKKLDKNILKEYNAKNQVFLKVSDQTFLPEGQQLDKDILDIQKALSKFGDVHSFKLSEKENKWLGYGYVTFTTQEAANKALEFDPQNGEQSILSRYQVRFSKYQVDRPHLKNNLYIRDFIQGDFDPAQFNITDIQNQLQQKYSQFGEINSLIVKLDEKVQKPYSFICFKEEKSAEDMFKHVSQNEKHMTISYQIVKGQGQQDISERYLYFKNLKSKEGDQVLDTDTVANNIRKMIEDDMKLGPLQCVKCGVPPPASSSFQQVNKEATPTYWAFVIFALVDNSQNFLKRYQKECKSLFKDDNPHTGVTICLPKRLREEFKKLKIRKQPMNNFMQNFQQMNAQLMGQQQHQNFNQKQNMMPFQFPQPSHQRPFNNYNRNQGQGQFQQQAGRNFGKPYPQQQPRNMNQMPQPRQGQMQQNYHQPMNPNYGGGARQQDVRPLQNPQQQQTPQLTLNVLINNVEQFLKQSGEIQQHQLGSLVYPKVDQYLKDKQLDHSLAAKITGMFIDLSVFEISDIVDFMQDMGEFEERITEALELIEKEKIEALNGQEQ